MAAPAAGRQPATPRVGEPVAKVDTSPSAAERKLSFKDQRALEQLPARVEQLESEIVARTAAMNDPAFFQRFSSKAAARSSKPTKPWSHCKPIWTPRTLRWAELDG
ncbi:MAG: hypothetical protein V4567_06120 [Pseudomonadota bacterium]